MLRVLWFALGFALTSLTLLALPDQAGAQGAPFCVVSGAGTQCQYFTRSQCEQVARTLDGGCVANSESAGGAAASSSPNRYYIAPPDIAGRFQQGMDNARQRQFNEESRALELERQRLENENIRRQGQTVVAGPEGSSSRIPDDVWLGLQVCLALRDRLLEEPDYEQGRPFIEAFRICMNVIQPHLPATLKDRP